MEKRGAEVFSLDVSDEQLRSAQIFKQTNASGIHLIHGNAEQLPFGDESLDYALSEYGRRFGATLHLGAGSGQGPKARWAASVLGTRHGR